MDDREAVTLEVAGREVAVARGQRLHLCLLRAGVMIETPCGSRGKCRKCRVRVRAGDWPVTAAERDQLSAEELAAGFRLSCQQVVRGDGAVAVVPEVLASSQKTGISRLRGEVPTDGWWPRALAPAHRPPLGIAVDIGTTTIVVALLRLDTGEELAGFSTPNPQGGYGADLMSRLSYAISGEDARHELQAVVVGAINDLVARICRRARCEPDQVIAAAVVGNTAMHHLLLGLPVDSLALAPYVPSVTAGIERKASQLGIAINPDAILYALPNVAGFVGADAVAVMLACGLDQALPGPTMAADIGTNGEIAVAGASASGEQRIVCCSAPAGPAFEGGEISQGMRAGPGAIEAVDIVYDRDGRPIDLHARVLGGGPARGICGSGLLDAVAAAVRSGLLDPGGQVPEAAEARRRLGPGLGMRVVASEAGRGIRLAPGVILTQKDVRSLQLAKGAIRSGMEIALREFGIGAEDLDAIFLAGAFGNYLHPEAALACGLVPPVPPARLRPAGNAAAQGCKLVLLSTEARKRAEHLGRTAQHVELATHPDFEGVFFAALNFPA